MAVDMAMPILVVDDYKTMVRIIKNLLRQLGFDNVDEAEDGGSALEKLRAKNYGLVISDWRMEPVDGQTLVNELRQDTTLQQTPVIVMTALDGKDAADDACQAGVNDFIVKPFNARSLKEKIARVVGDF